ncbi:V-set and immunoglobulin domain-containing protein 1-like isoform X2 [Thunnus thynnus]|uniref:V-set and immunoglobulin domain-containing protein 1-like isoform X2 n=1 Tax=Thunnus thynnus TaxID=8237 RepID=UPI003527C9B1
MIYCVLTCNGDTTGAEPVTYRWTSGDKSLSSAKEHKITKEDNELWFSCAFENPVSFNSSEKVRNPFNKEPLYRKIGDKAVLTPDSVVNPIKSIAWTHGPSIAMEWFRNGDETSSYRQFKDRGSLNTSTGALTITGLTPDDSGNYTVEINNKVTSKTELLVISLVSKPTVSVWCVMIYCILTCNGDTTGAEPVTYWWTSGNTTWSSTKEHKITMEDKEPWFCCAFENPVSFNSSEKVPNPFIKWVLIWTFIFIAVFILVVCIIIIYFRCTRRAREAQRRWQEFLQRWDKEFQEMLDKVNSKIPEINKTSTQDLETAESPDTSNETERPASLVEETSPQDTTSTGPPETSNETERSTTSPDVPETSTQDLETAESPDPSNETEMSVLLPPVENPSTQDPTSVVTQDPSNETEESAMIPDNAETRC